MDSKTTVLTLIEFKTLINNVNNIAIRRYTEAKKLFESIKKETAGFKSYEAVQYKNDYFIMTENAIIDVLVSLETIRAIIDLKRDGVKRVRMFKALGIDINKEIPRLLYIKVTQKYS